MENNSVVFVSEEKPKCIEYRDYYRSDLGLQIFDFPGKYMGISRGVAGGKGDFDGEAMTTLLQMALSFKI